MPMIHSRGCGSPPDPLRLEPTAAGAHPLHVTPARPRPASLAVGIATLLLSGCINVIDFDPVGNGASIAGAWTIDGEEANAARCTTLGSPLVQVVFIDEGRPVVHSGLRFECRTATFDTDSRGGAGAVIADGSWTLRLEALDGSGLPIAVSEELSYEVPSVDRIVLPTIEFSTGQLSGEFSLDGIRPTRATCEEAGIATVELAFEQAAASLNRSEPCEVGIVGTRLPSGFDYGVQLRALSETGAVLRESTMETVSVAAGVAATMNGGAPIELQP